MGETHAFSLQRWMNNKYYFFCKNRLKIKGISPFSLNINTITVGKMVANGQNFAKE